jgi:hypothetical protein
MIHCRRSAANTNSNGERGSPCLTPRSHWKCFPGTPLRRIEVKLESRILWVQSHHLLSNPSCLIICIMRLCSTVSKAFVKLSLRMMISFLDGWHWCIYCYVQDRQYWIVLDLMNPFWLVWMRRMILPCNLLAINFVMILSAQFKREIGLKSLTLAGCLSWGLRWWSYLWIPDQESHWRCQSRDCRSLLW